LQQTLNKFDFISNKLATTVGDINHYMPTKYCKGGKLLLGEIYELIEENEAKFLLQISSPLYQIDILQYLCEKNIELWRDYLETYQFLYGNSPKDIFTQQYGHDHLIENDQYGQSINDQVLEFNGHEMSNESNLEWNGEKSIIGQELQIFFVPNVESKENTDQFSKDEILIEEKSILTQELILGGHEIPCEFNLEKNGFYMKNNDQLGKDEEISDEKLTND
jgi:hypothetical protein